MPGLVAIVLTATVLVVCALVFRNINRAMIATTLFLIYFFSYGQFFNVLENTRFYGWKLGIHTYLLPAWTLLFSLIGYATIIKKRDLRTLHQLLFITSVCLILISLVNVFSFLIRAKTDTPRQEPSQADISQTHSNSLPDIYYIILDGYARGDILKEMYDHDNSDFLDSLGKKGFYVAHRSKSNYMRSLLSISSSLNMTHINDVTNHVNTQQVGHYLSTLIQQNEVARLLSKQGYASMAYPTGYANTEMKKADYYLKDTRTLSEFENELINLTPLSALNKVRSFQYERHREQLLYVLNRLGCEPDVKQPKFVFAHIMCPHAPFVFGALGEHIVHNGEFTLAGRTEVASNQDELRTYLKGYSDQVTFLNQKVLELVDRILSIDKRPAIILLQADHGDRWMVDFKNPERSDLETPFCIFNSYYFPEGDYSRLYETISPVNSFRVLFNQFFDGDYALHGDDSYYYKSSDRYRFLNTNPANVQSQSPEQKL